MKSVDLIELARSAAGQREFSLAAGETLFREGEAGEVMYVITDGVLRLTINDEFLDTELMGGVVGEMAIIENSPRSATAVAIEDSRLIPLGMAEFTALVSRQPGFAIHIMRIQSQRLRKANDVLNLF
ncbi:MAG: cyclic nucleotide-binding domain-containing protein [Xanthomonadales bacterium]|nr:cyclic nucleotide-binding domain-containing protein [Xanthomonadales bacterium]